MTERKQYSAADRRQALRLYREGWGYKRISEIIGCFPTTIKKWVIAAGQRKHPGPKHPRSKREVALRCYQIHHISINDAARLFGIHPTTMSRWLHEEEVAIKGPRLRVNRKGVLADIVTGMRKKDIATKHECSESWVYRIQSGTA